MGVETMETPKIDRLDLKHRAPLHIEVMKLMLGDSPSIEEELAWDLKYAKEISDLIDYHEHDEVRELAEDGDYLDAAALLVSLLEENQ